MKRRDYLALYVICIVLYSGLLFVQHTPGYMDSEYYYAGGLQLTNGSGFSEPYLWNYLNASESLPNPAFLYWMPLTSLVAGTGMALLRSSEYLAARIPFILLAGFIPLITAFLAEKFSSLKFAGWYAGAIAVIGGYYLPFITHSDTFALYMIAGGLFFFFLTKIWGEGKTWIKGWGGFIVLGLISGLMHLARADGILWLIAAISIVWIPRLYRKTNFSGESLALKREFARSGEILAGYLAVMGAWYVRNIQLFGSIMPPDNAKNLWLTEYNDLFVYPSSLLTIERWATTGAGKIISDRVVALGINLETLIGVGGGILLTVFMILGIIQYRKSPVIKYLLFLLGFGLFVMSFVFPFAGERGGFFHSLAAFQPILWALVPAGIDAAIMAGVRHRKWNSIRSWKMFGGTILTAFAIITGFVFFTKVEGNSTGQEAWDQQPAKYQLANAEIIKASGDYSSGVMVVDPPGFYLASGRNAVVTPQGDLDVVRAAAKAYGIKYLVLDTDLTAGLMPLYYAEEPIKGFNLVGSSVDLKIYELEP